jgi:hypothetical protein
MLNLFGHIKFALTYHRIDGINPTDIICTYRPAKRRGPAPGRSSLVLKAMAESMMNTVPIDVGVNNLINIECLQQQFGDVHDKSCTVSNTNECLQQHAKRPQQPSIFNFYGMVNVTPIEGNNPLTLSSHQQLASGVIMVEGGSDYGNAVEMRSSIVPHSIQDHLNELQQQILPLQEQLSAALQFQQQLQLAQNFQQEFQRTQEQFQRQPIFLKEITTSSDMTMFKLQANTEFQEEDLKAETQLNEIEMQHATAAIENPQVRTGIPEIIASYKHMLDPADADGSRLLAYYRLSIDELFRLPSTPSKEEYSLNTDQPLVGRQEAIFSAAKFAELALGAIVKNEVTVAIELHNAAVHCLQEVSHEQVDESIFYEVARTYFLLCIFRSIRGDMVRYFKYRRVALSHVAKLQVR